MSFTNEAVDRQDVLAEVTACFHAYEAAFMANDLPTLIGFFWQDERLTRYGVADRQLGHAEQAAYRHSVPTPSFTRQLENLRISSFGPDTAVALVEFVRSDSSLRGFQSQTWARMPEGWRIVSAHVSMIPWPPT
ncbi:nuclear transport factor 2 family protein [Ideonella azotifigens]|uniref:Oxalurate catabolism protein HpxZ n=1 Tax=Ideonella azotifigens TaxID=513160 RepID=A0ABN1JZQ0_9BURK|nr:AtzH-like domain-containing protein [Ideonella azotifigens]MCD2342631.1 nuclear transport factor 2 family protein [Ideonella azotifigens]